MGTGFCKHLVVNFVIYTQVVAAMKKQQRYYLSKDKLTNFKDISYLNSCFCKVSSSIPHPIKGFDIQLFFEVTVGAGPSPCILMTNKSNMCWKEMVGVSISDTTIGN